MKYSRAKSSRFRIVCVSQRLTVQNKLNQLNSHLKKKVCKFDFGKLSHLKG